MPDGMPGGMFSQADGTFEFTNGTELGSGGAPVAVASASRIASWQTDHVITVPEIGTHFNNLGAAGEVKFTLPPPQVGLVYGFFVGTAALIKIVCAVNTEQVIRVGSDVTTLDGFGNVQSDVVGSYLEVEAVSAATWASRMVLGTWLILTRKLMISAAFNGSGKLISNL